MKAYHKRLSLVALLAALCMLLASCAGEPQQISSSPGVQESSTAPQPESSQAEAAQPEQPAQAAAEEGPVYLYLTRHGQTITNTTRRMVSGQGNTPLTEAGREVAYYLGVGLSGTPFKAAYCSSLHRTYETASIVLEQNHTGARNLPIQSIHDLREVDVGGFEGMTYAEIMQEYGLNFSPGVAMETFVGQFHDADPTGQAESFETFQQRTLDSIKAICEAEAKEGGGNVLVVAHGAVNNIIAYTINGDGNPLPELENSSIVLIEYDKGELAVKAYGDMSYIERAQKAMETPQPVEIHLVVTAQTNADEDLRVNNIFDGYLTDAGIQSAQAAGGKIGALTAVYSSDQWKDLQTAEHLAEGSQNSDLLPYTDSALRGIFLGNFECDLIEKLPEVPGETPTVRARLAAYTAADEMVETYDAASSRILPVVRSIAESTYGEGGGSVAVVTSALAQQMIAEELAGATGLAPLENGDVLTLVFDGTGYEIK